MCLVLPKALASSSVDFGPLRSKFRTASCLIGSFTSSTLGTSGLDRILDTVLWCSPNSLPSWRKEVLGFLLATLLTSCRTLKGTGIVLGIDFSLLKFFIYRE